MSMDAGLEKGFKGMFGEKKRKKPPSTTESEEPKPDTLASEHPDPALPKTGQPPAVEEQFNKVATERAVPTGMAALADPTLDPKEMKEPSMAIMMEEFMQKVKDHMAKGIAAQQSGADVLPKGDLKQRFVGQIWPRDPKGKLLVSTSWKTAGRNGIGLWGATLADFFLVSRMADVPGYFSHSTSSRLLSWCKKENELEFAKAEIEWAEEEADPEPVLPAKLGVLVEADETRIRAGIIGRSLVSKANDTSSSADSKEATVQDNEKKPDGTTDHGSPQPAAEEVTTESGKALASSDAMVEFDSEASTKDDKSRAIDQAAYLAGSSTLGAAYSAPWPLVPFSYDLHPLQERLPYYLLPEKLVVCDPYAVLPADHSVSHLRGTETRWEDGTHPGRTRTYTLKLEPAVQKQVAAERELLRVTHEDNVKRIHSSYLGINLTKKGNPTDDPEILIPGPTPYIPPAKIPTASLYLSPSHYIGRGNHSYVYSAELEVPREVFVPHEPIICMQCVKDSIAAFDATPAGKKKLKKASTTKKAIRYERNEVTVEYQYPDGGGPCCSHLDKPASQKNPPTCKTSIIAKLSIQHDHHLAREAKNYQRFPDHFYEHWSGFNIVEPLHDPTPVGAIVPQFYGYYVPDPPKKGEMDVGDYLSPLLLMEDCGSQIDPTSLGIDDRNEAAALFFRFLHAGWSHQSVATRNILMAHGSISSYPINRRNKDHRFRLIDFGRSQPASEMEYFPSHRCSEESSITAMMEVLHCEKRVVSTAPVSVERSLQDRGQQPGGFW